MVAAETSTDDRVFRGDLGALVFGVVAFAALEAVVGDAMTSRGELEVERFLRVPVTSAEDFCAALFVWRRCCGAVDAWRAPLRLPSCRCLLILLPPVPLSHHNPTPNITHVDTLPRFARQNRASMMRRHVDTVPGLTRHTAYAIVKAGCASSRSCLVNHSE